MCKVNQNGVDVNTCNKVKVEGDDIDHPVIINNDLLYTSRSKIYRCAIASNGLVDNSKCTGFTMGDDKRILGLTIANNMVYLIQDGGGYQKPSSLVQCKLSDSGIDTSSCTTSTPSGVGELVDTQNIYVNNSNAFITNNKNITQCSVKNGSISVDSCQNYSINDEDRLSATYVYNNKLYAVNDDYSPGKLFQCNLRGNALDASSCKTLSPGGDNQLLYTHSLIIQ